MFETKGRRSERVTSTDSPILRPIPPLYKRATVAMSHPLCYTTMVPRGGAARLARVAHNHKVAGSNPAPATKKDFSKTGRSFLFVYFSSSAARIL